MQHSAAVRKDPNVVQANIIVGSKTMVYSGFHERGNEPKKMFIRVNDLISDSRDPQVLTLDVSSEKGRWSSFCPWAVNATPVATGRMYEITLETTDGFNAHPSVEVHSSTWLMEEVQGPCRLSQLLEKHLKSGSLVCNLSAYSFVEFKPVWRAFRITAAPTVHQVSVQALRSSYHSSNSHVVLNNGLIIGR